MAQISNIECEFNKQQWKNEAAVTTVFMSKLRALSDSRWYKIPDIGNKTKPLDIIWNLYWHFVCIEVKHDKRKTVPKDIYKAILSKCEPHQIMALEINSRAGGLSYIAWYFEVLNKLFICPWKQMH